MENIEGGIRIGAATGIMCAATVFLAFSLVFAPLAGATGTGCAVGLYALDYWEDQGLNVE